MPTIRKRGDRQWHVQIRKRGYPTQTRTFDTQEEAENWATVIESEMIRGVFVSRAEAEATLVRDVLQRYEREVLPTKRSAPTDRSRLKTLDTAFGDYRLASLTSAQVASFRDQRLRVVGSQSVIHELNLLNRVLKSATMDWGIALPAGLPTAMVRKPAKPRGRERRVTNDEISRILAATQSDELSAIITLAVETAMRRSEIAALRWQDVDLKNELYTFQRRRQTCRGPYRFPWRLYEPSSPVPACLMDVSFSFRTSRSAKRLSVHANPIVRTSKI